MLLSTGLNHYLASLDLTVPEALNLNFVQSLVARHLAQYPFSNLALVLGESVSLDTDDILCKLVERNMGGYCFEHNKVVFELLFALGFTVELKLARVLNNQQKDAPRTHRITLLTIESQTYLVDVGFGGSGPISAIQLIPDLEQTSGCDTFKIVLTEHQEYELQVLRPEGFYTLYRFDTAQYTDADCDAANFYSSCYPKAGFLNNLVMSLKNEKQMTSIRNHRLIIRTDAAETESLIPSPETLQDAMRIYFSVSLTEREAHTLFIRFLAPKLAETGVQS